MIYFSSYIFFYFRQMYTSIVVVANIYFEIRKYFTKFIKEMKDFLGTVVFLSVSTLWGIFYKYIMRQILKLSQIYKNLIKHFLFGFL